MAKLDTSKETKNDDQKGETSWKHPAKPAEDSETKIPVGYSVKKIVHQIHQLHGTTSFKKLTLTLRGHSG